MAESIKRSVSQEINTWVQTTGIIVAAIWGIYTFGYKEILVPQSAPVNISMNLQLQKVAISNKKENKLIAVEMKVSATNPSSRVVKLLPSVWFAYGKEVVPVSENTSFSKKLFTTLNTRNEGFIQKHAESKFASVVAAGNLFQDDFLQPKETRARTIIFHIPKNKYDVLEVQAIMPSAENTKPIYLQWTFNDEVNAPIYNIYRVDEKGVKTLVEPGKINDFLKNEVQMSISSSNSRLSLLR